MSMALCNFTPAPFHSPSSGWAPDNQRVSSGGVVAGTVTRKTVCGPVSPSGGPQRSTVKPAFSSSARAAYRQEPAGRPDSSSGTCSWGEAIFAVKVTSSPSGSFARAEKSWPPW
ncbi:hypothetical protein [Cystobacter fuscus]|uniref:hypothetical protein n=1 Tax=Cystobacter fuscus TaxID=43 RepID=UPI0037BED06D